MGLGAIAVASGGLIGCATDSPTPSPNPSPTPTTGISSTVLALIQTAATIATGAVLNFAVSQASSRTQLANQIYASAKALYEASGGTALTPTDLNTLLQSYSVGGVSQYTQYVSAVEGLYNSYYAKYVMGGSTGVQNFAAIANAIAAGAEAGASTYETVTTAISN